MPQPLSRYLLTSAFVSAGAATARSADLPVTRAAPIEYVRVCSAYGAGFFYIPGTDTCLRVSGRARFEGGYMTSYSRANGNGDTAGYQARMRLNIDARTQTGFGTLRAFVRLDAGSRTGYPGVGTSGIQQRIANAFPALGIDQFGRTQQYMNTDKAFVQFAGLTAGRAASFFDFYAHDFEFVPSTAGSDAFSTNLLAYTTTLGNGLSATLSVEDPTFRRSPTFSPFAVVTQATNGAVANVGITNQPSPIVVGYTDATPSRFTTVDVIERNRMPDFVGVLRLDQPFGSVQGSAAIHEVNAGGISTATSVGTGSLLVPNSTSAVYGFAVQGGVKINLPFIAPGDTLYIQAAYGEGAQIYTGYSSFSGLYAQTSAPIQGPKFNLTFSDAVLNPFTGRLQLSDSLSVVGAYLHYWTPQWRSAYFGSYGQQTFGKNIRAAQGAISAIVPALFGAGFGLNNVGTPGTLYYNLSEALRDTYQVVIGSNLIWSPVKDLDIGIEGLWILTGVQQGQVIDQSRVFGVTPANFNALLAAGAIRTTKSYDAAQFRLRVQRDF